MCDIIEYIGPTYEQDGPGSERFNSLIKSVATSANRVGRSSNYGYFFLKGQSRNSIIAEKKLRQAHRLLLGAHALLLEEREN